LPLDPNRRHLNPPRVAKRVAIDPQGPRWIAAARQAACERLLDGVLHDVRNPLNALAIHLDVMAEKIAAADPALALACARNVAAIRAQLLRVDAVLRRFVEFGSPGGPSEGAGDLGVALREARDLLAFESRRSGVQLLLEGEEQAPVPGLDRAAGRALALLGLLRGMLRTVRGGEVTALLERSGTRVRLEVSDDGPESREPLEGAVEAMDVLSRAAGGTFQCRVGVCEVRLGGDQVAVGGRVAS
jgi:signal transduction histidine kinase